MKRGKKYLAALEKIEEGKKYTLEDAVSKLKEIDVVGRRSA
jgi:ribosomal protein L1